MPCYKDEKLGTWYCQFYYTDFTGVKKQKRKRGFKTRREALEWEREFQLKKSKNCDMTLSSFVDLYFADMKGRLRDSTIDNKRQIFDTKIIPYLGKRKMDEITAMDIREWQKTVKKAGEDTGLPYAETYLLTIRVHDLRHSHASLCIELGYSALLVAKRLGDTVPVVMKTSAHLNPNKQAELVSKLEDLAAPENEDSGYLGSL